MITAKKLHPKKYRAGSWSKANMKWTRAEEWAAWGKAKAEDELRSLCDNRGEIEMQLSTDKGLEQANQQRSIDGGRERTQNGTDFQQVSDASA